MKYWKFDVIGLLRDYHQNQNAVASVRQMIRQTKNEIKNPFVDTDAAMLKRRIAQLECKEQEYQMYCDLVVMGFNVITEEQRIALEMCYVEGHGITDGAAELDVPARELKQTVKSALIDFARVVSPL